MTNLYAAQAVRICTPERIEQQLRKAGAVGGETITDMELAVDLADANPNEETRLSDTPY
jgi:hypothetical protein